MSNFRNIAIHSRQVDAPRGEHSYKTDGWRICRNTCINGLRPTSLAYDHFCSQFPPRQSACKQHKNDPLSYVLFQRFYQLFCKLALMLGMPALIIVVRESQPLDPQNPLGLIYSDRPSDIIVQGLFLGSHAAR